MIFDVTTIKPSSIHDKRRAQKSNKNTFLPSIWHNYGPILQRSDLDLATNKYDALARISLMLFFTIPNAPSPKQLPSDLLSGIISTSGRVPLCSLSRNGAWQLCLRRYQTPNLWEKEAMLQAKQQKSYKSNNNTNKL